MVDGEPRSWRHFVAGLRHLARARARESLRLASSISVTQMGEKQKHLSQAWFREQTAAAGWRA